jgi:uncharacterized membrane protein YbhN (UPF0104 family)
MNIRPRSLAMLWITVFAGPVAWWLSLAVMFWLTRKACVQSTTQWVLTAGMICAAVSVVAGIRAGFSLTRPLGHLEITRFMLILALSASAIFALVIVLSMVPISLLSPCPM